MKKLFTSLAVIFAFLCDNEIITLFIIAIAVSIVAVVILAAWAKTEKPKLPGSFDSDWGKK